MKSKPSHARAVLFLAALSPLAALLAAGCASTPLGASETGLKKAREQSAPGAQVYERSCAGCHGHKGEGVSGAPALMGSGALPTYAHPDMSQSAFASGAQQQPGATVARPPGQSDRPPFNNAADLYDYVHTKMPLPANRAGSLSTEDYWAVVNYILLAHGSPVPEGGVNEGNAKSVPITR